MQNFHPYTPVRIALPYVSGVIAALSGIFQPDFVQTIIALAITAVGFFIAGGLAGRHSWRWLPGTIGMTALLIGGMATVSLFRTYGDHADRLLNSSADYGPVILRIADTPRAGEDYWSAEAELVAVSDSLGNWKTSGLKVMARIQSDSGFTAPVYGDTIAVSGGLGRVKGPVNPDAFDYRNYLSFRSIRWQIQADQYLLLGKSSPEGHALWYWSKQCSAQIREIFRQYRIEGEELALVSALLLGTKDLLSPETGREFSHAGAMHVLCVSGLHVGVIYVMADKALFFLKRWKRLGKLRQILIIAIIWAFAFITGMASSVLRAGLMFSLMAMARMMNRSRINYNILASAALIQLIINPFDIAQVGFQLSYLAVLGIFAFYKPINDLVSMRNQIVSWIWPVMAVSLAAQLATSPLACGLFHIFPVYFLLTNLIVVPLSGVIIYLAIGLITLGSLGVFHDWLAFPLIGSLRLMQGSVGIIQSLPGSVIEDIYVPVTTILVLYAAIAGLFMLWVLKVRKGLWVLALALILIVNIRTDRILECRQHSEFTVYSTPGSTAIDLIHNRKAYHLADSLFHSDPSKSLLKIQPHRLRTGVRSVTNIPLDSAGEMVRSDNLLAIPPLYYFDGMSFARVSADDLGPFDGRPFKVDVVVLSGRRRINADKLSEMLEFRQLVIDSSVPAYRLEDYIKVFRDRGIPCHSVSREGAFTLSWESGLAGNGQFSN